MEPDENREGVEPIEIGERERAHRMSHAELHCRVDGLDRPTPSYKAKIASLIIGIRMRFAMKPG